jgi:hypothetical protein
MIEELKEVQTKMMLSEDENVNLFKPFMAIIEEVLDPKSEIAFGHTQAALKFYQRYFKRNQESVLFVSYGQPHDDNVKHLLTHDKDFKAFQAN